MQLPLEHFLLELNLEIDSQELFSESFLCYKAGAYKAAYAFSYLGFMSILKFRILNSVTPPNGINAQQWSIIQGELRNIDKWEEGLLTQTQRQKDPVFFINDDLRNQVIYWKNRRNDCVHHKNNAITRITVEAFWDFLLHMLQRFQVNGSMGSLVSLIVDHFDVNKNPLGQDVTPLVQQIPRVMELRNYPVFFADLKNNIKPEEFFQIMDKIFLFSPGDLKRAGADFAFHQIKLSTITYFFRRYPQHCHFLSNYPQIVRSIWKGHLFTTKYNDYTVFCTFIRLRLIPNDQLEEAIETAVAKLDKAFPIDEDINTLKNTIFYTQLKDKYIVQKAHLDFYNSNKNKIRHYLENIEPDEDILKFLNYVVTRDFAPWGLNNSIDAMLRSNQQLADNFKAKFQEYNITPAKFYRDIFRQEDTPAE